MASNIKIIFDVNIWVSAFISPRMFQRVQAVILQDKLEIFACKELFEELRQTLQRPKFQRYISSENLPLAIELAEQSSTLIHLKSVVELCRDKNDNYLLALAKDAKADFLITGDEDLLVLKRFENTQIIKLSDYHD